MTLVGAIAAGLATACAIAALRQESRVGRWLDRIAPTGGLRLPFTPVEPRDLDQAAPGLTADRLLVAKLGAALTGLLASSGLALLVPIGPLVVVAAAYAGFIAPSVLIESRARGKRREAERAVATLIDRLDALVSAGQPPESALAALAAHSTGADLLDRVLRRSTDAYALGAPLFRTLAHNARAAGIEAAASLAEDLERNRDLGEASLALLRQRRDDARAGERARALEAASQVEGKLMLVLVLCYMPALMLLVVVPLFLSLLDGLFI